MEAVLLTDTMDEGIALMAEVATRPSFPEQETERVRAESLDALVAREDEPANVADDRVALEVFGRFPFAVSDPEPMFDAMLGSIFIPMGIEE